MKSLETLIKLQKTRVDEQRIHLSNLQDHLTAIENQIAELEITIVREQITAQENPESKLTYGAFIKASVQLGRELEKQRCVASDAVEVARNKLSDLFAEQKRYEVAEEARVEAERKAESRRDTLQMDEIGSINYTRKKK